MDTIFPTHVSGFLHEPPSEEAIGHALDEIYYRYGTVRDTNVLEQFLSSNLPAGTYYLYGAGTQSRQVREILEGQNDIQIEGFIDQHALKLGGIDGLPVYAVDEYLERLVRDIQGIIVCHATREPEMINCLHQCGIDEKLIWPVYTSNAIRPISEKRIVELLEENADLFSKKIDVVAISTLAHQYSVVSIEQLVELAGNKKVLHLSFGRPEFSVSDPRSFSDLQIETLNLSLSVRFLETILEKVHPSTIVATLSPHSDGEFLPVFLEKRHPQAMKLYQFYDMAGLFRSDRLKTSHGYSDEYIALARLGDFTACTSKALVISKNGGDLWDRLAATFTADSVSYFPGLDDSVCDQHSVETDVIKVVFAGSMSGWRDEREAPEHTDLNYMDYFQYLEADPAISLDMYNVAHVDETSDAAFSVYLQKFGDHNARVRYFRRVAQQTLIERMAHYDIGWLLCHNDTPDFYQPISKVAMANKMTAYLQAGLPIVMDKSYRFMSQLIEDSGAGFTASWEDRSSIPDRLKDCNFQEMKKASRALYGDLQKSNHSVVAFIREFFTAS